MANQDFRVKNGLQVGLGASVVGIVTAESFSGSAVGLTSVPSASLTGTISTERLSGTYNIDITGTVSGNSINVGTGDTGVFANSDGTLLVTGIATFKDRVIFDSTNSIQVPVGTEAEKDAVGVAVTGQIRYNTTNSQFEGFGPGNDWGSLGGVKDVDGDTYVKPESSPGSDEDALTFFTGGTERAVIDSDGKVGIGITNPTATLDLDGDLNVSGISTFNKISVGNTTGTNYQYLRSTGDGLAWDTFPVVRTGFSTIATAGQTGFSTSYNVGFIDVYINGIRLTDSEFTANDGTNIGLSTACFGGEYVDIIAYSTISTGSGGGGVGGGSLTIQNEGTPLTSVASILNFVGAGVTATGSGATKTITINGGGGGGSGGSSYTNSDVDNHLNVSTASSTQVLSWDGSDYDWIDQSASSGVSSLTDLSDATVSADLKSIGIGVDALINDDGTNNRNIGIGHSALKLVNTGYNNVAIGPGAGVALTDGSRNILIGYNAGHSLQSIQGNTAWTVTAIGAEALENMYTSSGAPVAIGYRALRKKDYGGYTVAIGGNVLAECTQNGGSHTVAIGYGVAQYTQTTNDLSDCVLIGSMVGERLRGNHCTFVGSNIAGNTFVDGSKNTFVGSHIAKGSGDPDSDDNTAVGYRAAYNIDDSAERNTLVGSESGYNLGNSTNNVLLGYQAGYGITSGGNNIVIGSGASVSSSSSTSNEITLGNHNITKFRIPGLNLTHNSTGLGIGTTQPTAKLDVDGTLNVSGIATFQSHVKLGDNSNLKIGADDDLEIYHNSVTNESIIKETGGSNFLIQGTNLHLQSASGEDYFVGTLDGSAELYYDNSKKLETTGYGVSVYGDARISGILTVGQSSVTIDGTTNEVVVGTGVTIQGNTGIVSATEVAANSLQFSENNPTVAGTSGTTGQFKQIGGAPFYYDGTAWREFALLEGTPVTTPGDTDWDNVMFRMDFEESGISSVTNLKNERSPHNTGFSNIDLVSSPGMTNFGKSLRFSANHNTLSWKQDPINTGTQTPLYDFEGAWTIEFWIHPTSLPTNGVNIAEQNSMLFVGQLDPSGTRDWGFGLMHDDSSPNTGIATHNYSFYWYNNEFSGTTSGTPGSEGSPFVLHTVVGNTLLNTWNHVALVKRQSNSEIQLYLNGSEVGNSVIDASIQNGSTNYVDSYITFGGYPDLTPDAYRRRFYGAMDDIRITTDERYTGNSFTVPTSPHPTTGTTSTVYTPPNSKEGEIALGASPTWTGTTGVTASQVASGQYRLTFSSAYSSTTAYTVNANMMDYDPATSIVGVGVSRVSSSTCDFYVRRLSDDSAVDTGSLAVSVYKK